MNDKELKCFVNLIKKMEDKKEELKIELKETRAILKFVEEVVFEEEKRKNVK